MKVLSLVLLAVGVSAVPHHRFRQHRTSTAVAQATTAATTTAAAAATSTAASTDRPAAVGGTVTQGDQTLVFREVNGVPGNECLTFRNNGEIVDAACVNDAADRQINPSTLGSQDVLLVQRSFTAGFRPDLVGVQACVGSNGTHFKALPCDSLSAKDFVTFTGSQLVTSGGACQNGHDDRAQVTVDTTGQTCATFTTTEVAPVAA